MKTGEKISKARRSVNLTQDQLAELLELTRQTISKWESDLALPEASKIAKLAEVLKGSCDYLLKDCKVMTTEVSMTSEKIVMQLIGVNFIQCLESIRIQWIAKDTIKIIFRQHLNKVQ